MVGGEEPGEAGQAGGSSKFASVRGWPLGRHRVETVLMELLWTGVMELRGTVLTVRGNTGS